MIMFIFSTVKAANGPLNLDAIIVKQRELAAINLYGELTTRLLSSEVAPKDSLDLIDIVSGMSE